MAATQRPVTSPTATKGPARPVVRVLPDESTIDVRAWAQQVVAATLEVEGVASTPTAAAEAAP